MAIFKIILADDHHIFREGLKSLLKTQSEFQIIGEASDGESLLEMLEHQKPDIVILDLSMPGIDGLAALKEIKKKYPDIRVLVLTMMKDCEHFKHCMAHGAWGYLLKDDAYDQLVLALKVILRDKTFVSPSVSNMLSEQMVRSVDPTGSSSVDVLTKREKEILVAVAKGYSNKKISADLKISIRTVESHRLNLCNKLGIHTIAGLVKYAMSKGLISP